MKIDLSSDTIRLLEKTQKKDKKLSQKIDKQLALFKENPKHPSLRTHKLAGNSDNRWSISITRSIRMVYILEEKDLAYFIDLGTHDEVYGK